MRFGDLRVFVGAVPGPVNGVGGDTLKIAFLAMKTFVLDKKPNLTFHHVVNLFGFMLMRLGVITRRAGSDHQAALVAVALFDDHRTGSRFTTLDSFRLRDIVVLGM